MNRDENGFYAEVETPPGEQVDFVLTYEQLLLRRLGVYQLSVPLGHTLHTSPVLLLLCSTFLTNSYFNSVSFFAKCR